MWQIQNIFQFTSLYGIKVTNAKICTVTFNRMLADSCLTEFLAKVFLIMMFLWCDWSLQPCGPSSPDSYLHSNILYIYIHFTACESPQGSILVFMNWMTSNSGCNDILIQIKKRCITFCTFEMIETIAHFWVIILQTCFCTVCLLLLNYWQVACLCSQSCFLSSPTEGIDCKF